jgi:hypothetical protein
MNLPSRIARLPQDRHGRPVPWFVAWIDGQPDFRIVAAGKFEQAIAERLCWVCGGKLTRHGAFVIGPMCAVNRTTAEPPCHIECAEFSAVHCPFLSNPRMRRNEKNLPEDASSPAGEPIRRNPGVALVWITRFWELFDDGRGGVLIHLNDPSETRWFREGRPATREEAWAAIESGLPILRGMAEKEPDAGDALAELAHAVEVATIYLPEEAA